MTFALRDYQSTLIDATREALREYDAVVLGVMPWAAPQCWPSAIVYRVLIDGVDYPIIGDMLTVIELPAAAYSLDAGRE